MHDEPRRILAQLLILYGPDLHSDPRRTEALLRDYCPQHAREIFVLVHAQKQRVAADLLAAPTWMPQAAIHAQLARRLQQNLALTEEAACWAVATWAAALRITPSPPDRVWVWLRQHAPSPEALGASRQFVRCLPAFVGRLFGQSGVQWKLPTFDSRQLGVQLVGGLRQLARRASALVRPPLLTPLVVMVSAWVTVAGVNQITPVTAESSSLLLGAYPLPRPAWVYAGPLIVRGGPRLEEAALGLLAMGEEVTVTAYSSDGEWAQIKRPQVGWVNQRFLRHRGVAPGKPTGEITEEFDVVIGLESGQARDGPANVRAGPGLKHPVVGGLQPHEDVVVIASSIDGGWKEIISPLHGWVHDELLDVDKDTKINP